MHARKLFMPINTHCYYSPTSGSIERFEKIQGFKRRSHSLDLLDEIILVKFWLVYICCGLHRGLITILFPSGTEWDRLNERKLRILPLEHLQI